MNEPKDLKLKIESFHQRWPSTHYIPRNQIIYVLHFGEIDATEVVEWNPRELETYSEILKLRMVAFQF